MLVPASYRHMICFIMELVSNHSFTLTTANCKQSRLPRLKTGVLQGSGLAPLLSLARWVMEYGATLSLARWVIEYGHLLHSAVMFTECKCMTSQIETPICPRRTTTIVISTDNNNIHAAHLADHQWNAKWLDK